jgi:hypothetical protein
MDNFVPSPAFRRPVAHRIDTDVRLQRFFDRLHRCGSRAMAQALAGLLDDLSIDADELDQLLCWEHLDPDLVAAVGGNQWPRRIYVVPPEREGGPERRRE